MSIFHSQYQLVIVRGNLGITRYFVAGPIKLFVTAVMGKSRQRHDKFLINTLMRSSPSGPSDDNSLGLVISVASTFCRKSLFPGRGLVSFVAGRIIPIRSNGERSRQFYDVTTPLAALATRRLKLSPRRAAAALGTIRKEELIEASDR